MNWTEERVAELTRLWSEGLSASRIAARMGGVSRNAVIGKVHRLGLPGRARSTKSETVHGSVTQAAGLDGAARPILHSDGATALKHEVLAEADLRPLDEVVVPISRKLRLSELTDKTCKWPVGDPLRDDFYFCGSDCGDAGPYCAYHASIAFQPLADRRRSR